ncbi:Mpo1-like protein [Falsiroseomonas sp. HW251]|uniref:Mpo1-like protein n=1 Tax=Falsiroseomonas sp. HW251 TaxID=3390998 RepID=UPI003D323882
MASRSTGFASYGEFWPHYLRQHANPMTRRVHAVGTVTGLLIAAFALLFGDPAWLLLALLVGYGLAWASHLLVEGNRPATFGHPLWSLASDLRMAWLMLTGRLGPELERAGLR